MSLNEFTAEDAALKYFGELGYLALHMPRLAPGEPEVERDSYGRLMVRQFPSEIFHNFKK